MLIWGNSPFEIVQIVNKNAKSESIGNLYLFQFDLIIETEIKPMNLSEKQISLPKKEEIVR